MPRQIGEQVQPGHVGRSQAMLGEAYFVTAFRPQLILLHTQLDYSKLKVCSSKPYLILDDAIPQFGLHYHCSKESTAMTTKAR